MAITSIWSNRFYSLQKPLPKWLFEVDFQSFFGNIDDGYGREDAMRMTMAVTNCKWGKREMSVVKTYFAGIEANFPGRVSNTGEMEIKFNESENLGITNLLEREFRKLESSTTYFNTDNVSYSEYTFHKTDKIIKLKIFKPKSHIAIDDSDTDVIGEVTFYNCWLKSINEEEMDYESTEEVVTRTAVFSYDYMTFEQIKKFHGKNRLYEKNKPAALKI